MEHVFVIDPQVISPFSVFMAVHAVWEESGVEPWPAMIAVPGRPDVEQILEEVGSLEPGDLLHVAVGVGDAESGYAIVGLRRVQIGATLDKLVAKIDEAGLALDQVYSVEIQWFLANIACEPEDEDAEVDDEDEDEEAISIDEVFDDAEFDTDEDDDEDDEDLDDEGSELEDEEPADVRYIALLTIRLADDEASEQAAK